MTSHERSTGQPPSVSHFRPMFCLAFARRPYSLQELKLKPRADKCIQLLVVSRELVLQLRANYYQPPDDDTDRPSIDELVVMYNADGDDSVAAAPGGTLVCCNWALPLSPVTDADSDASFETGRSTSGYSFILSDAAIAWGMKKQSIAMSTACCMKKQ
eukprot:4128483-Pleurochrysis_carterae.AAC.10